MYTYKHIHRAQYKHSLCKHTNRYTQVQRTKTGGVKYENVVQ